MKTLERLLRHDAWTTRTLVVLSSELSDAELDREFDIGHRTLRRTFVHIIRNMECWCDLMSARPQRWGEDGSAAPAQTISGLKDRIDAVAGQLLELSRSVEEGNREDELFVDYLDQPPTRKSLGGGLVHVATHGMHHRAQCLYIMRRLGVKNLIEGDALGWERIHLGLEGAPGP
jgi:uncharacterized damage-inducible protein DinB